MSLISLNSVGELCAEVSRTKELAASCGSQVVMTADRTLMSSYDLLFDGMLAASQTTTIPPKMVSWLLMPPPGITDGSCSVAPLGLRRVEAALLRSGMNRWDVSVVDGDHLDKVIGPSTRIVAVSSGEPCGLGMNTSTMTGIAGGQIYPEVMFLDLMKKISRIKRKQNLDFKVVMGGPGAWQLADNPEKMQNLGIDHVITGYCEANVAALFSTICHGGNLPAVLEGQMPQVYNIPPIVAPSTMGVVEISRGCGLGCSFCTIACTQMMHLPISTILADVRTNIAGGIHNAAILSEDFFRYGSSGGRVDAAAVIELLEALRKIDGLKLIQIDHCNISSVAQLSDDELNRIHDLLTKGVRHEKLWVNVGIETPNGDLMYAAGCGAKMGGVEPAAWGAFCSEQLRRLCKAGFMPMLSLLLGLPDEEPKHIEETITWVQSIANENVTIFPVIYAPVDGQAPPDPRSLSKRHWDLVAKCYDLNFSRIPGMYWDNQTGAGVALWKRLMIQVIGKGQVVMWKSLIALGRSKAHK